MDLVSAMSELGEHGGEAVENRFHFDVFGGVEGFADFEDVLGGGAFEDGAAGYFEVAATVVFGGFSVAFGYVERNGLGCAEDLVLGVCVALECLGEAMNPADIFDREAIDVELFVAKGHVRGGEGKL